MWLPCSAEHVPWTLPDRPWAVRQRWLDLSFLHWRVEAAVLRERLPEGVNLDLHEGQAWIGVVPFRMDAVRPRGLPAVPGLSRFPELNLRTYVVRDGRPGVLFFSLDTPSRLTVEVGRRRFCVPYRAATQELQARDGGTWFRSEREELEWEGLVRPVGDQLVVEPGSVEHFLTERYCFYSARPDGTLLRADVLHPPWPVQLAEAELRVNRLLDGFGVADPLRPDLCHASRGVQVVGWTPESLG